MPARKKGTRSSKNAKRARRSSAPATAPSAVLELEVVHGDITRVPDADVYVAGHYIDVTPQFAEEALDEIVSDESLKWVEADRNNPDAMQLKRSRRVIHGLTIRRTIRGALGETYLFPMAAWHAATLDGGRDDADGRLPRMIAVAGMGHLGTFGVTELRRLAQAVAGTVARLPDRTRICSVLIGGGFGNIPVEQAVEGLVSGIAEGLLETAPDRLFTLRLVERSLGRAHQIFRGAKERFSSGSGVRLRGSGPAAGEGGGLSEGDSYVLSIGSLVALAKQGSANTKRLEQALKPASDTVGNPAETVKAIRESLGRYASETLGKDATPEDAVIDALVNLEVRARRDRSQSAAPTRLTCVREVDDKGRGILSLAALSSTAVVPKRYNPIDWDLVLDVAHQVEVLGERPTPSEEQTRKIPDLLRQLLVPRDFREYVGSARGGASLDAPLVFELDRQTARIHWEMLDTSEGSNEGMAPVAICRQVSRQLRTEYSSAPGARAPDGDRLGVLLIASPGEPGDENYLTGALMEVESLLKLFNRMGPRVTIDVLAGSPDDDRSKGLMAKVPAATRLETLQRLLSTHYDIVHYSGHAWFDEKEQTKSGWYFSDGVLTAGELGALDTVPQLVVANACVSARTAQTAGRRRDRGTPRDYALAPGLADEFFKRGVRAYIGTAWSIADDAAVRFAGQFYRYLLLQDPAAKSPRLQGELSSAIGHAMLAARKELWEARSELGLAWAAYQHYGDPTLRLAFPGSRG
jgi:hypothetical protein